MGRIDRTAARLLIIAAAGFVVLVVAASGDAVHVWRDRPPSIAELRDRGDDAVVVATTLPPIPVEEDEEPELLPEVAIVLVALLVGFVLSMLVAAFARRPQLRRRRARRRPTSLLTLPTEPTVVVVDEGAQLSALREGSPRNAIVACWVQMEEDVARAGIPQHPAETASEYTSRVLSMTPLDPAPVAELAALYREARFSRHELDETHRERAAVAVLQIHRELGAHAAEVAAAAAAAAAAADAAAAAAEAREGSVR